MSHGWLSLSVPQTCTPTRAKRATPARSANHYCSALGAALNPLGGSKPSGWPLVKAQYWQCGVGAPLGSVKLLASWSSLSQAYAMYSPLRVAIAMYAVAPAALRGGGSCVATY